MAFTTNIFLLSATLLLIFTFSSLDFTVAQIGVCYGRNGAVPTPARTVALFKQYNIRRMRIYEPDPETLQALRGSDIELTVGILNWKIQESAGTRAAADAWVQNNVRNYGNVRFRTIVVGNEVFPLNAGTQQYAGQVLPAMRNIRAALNAANLGQIKVTTAVGTEVLAPDNFPPSRSEFRAELRPYLDPIVQFLVETGSPLFASIYPYFAYVGNKQIDFNYAFLQPGSQGVNADGFHYDNLYYALTDNMNVALEKSTARISSSLEQSRPPRPPPEVVGAESGVPTEGGTDATSSVANARMYNNNLVQVVKKGTPRRPNKPIETYIFAMFDENQKPGPAIEKHFGLFNSNGDPKYPVNFN